MIMNNIKATSS